MKLSQAMLKGCEMAPQKCVGMLFAVEGRGKRARVVATCALGAAILGFAGHQEVARRQAKGRHWCEIIDGLHVSSELCREIVTRSDQRGHTREQVAEWLDRHGQ